MNIFLPTLILKLISLKIEKNEGTYIEPNVWVVKADKKPDKIMSSTKITLQKSPKHFEKIGNPDFWKTIKYSNIRGSVLTFFFLKILNCMLSTLTKY